MIFLRFTSLNHDYFFVWKYSIYAYVATSFLFHESSLIGSLLNVQSLLLRQANAILLPLESVLSKDVTAMTDAMARERETKMEISPIHGQAIYLSYYSRIKEACQAYKPLVPSLTSSVKGLHSMLTRLARTASLHAGNLHKVMSYL